MGWKTMGNFLSKWFHVNENGDLAFLLYFSKQCLVENIQGKFQNILSVTLISEESLLSAYEVKNNCHLFERFSKVKKIGVFLFGISLFVIEIFTFLYYANEESDDVIDGSLK